MSIFGSTYEQLLQEALGPTYQVHYNVQHMI